MSVSHDSAIAQEIVSATKIRKYARETENRFRKRLLFSANQLPDSRWGRLSDPAKKWLNEAADAYNKNKTMMPPYPDEDQILAKKRALSSVGGFHRITNGKKRQGGAGVRLRELMLIHGVRTPPTELYRLLGREGFVYSLDTIKLVRADFRRDLQVLAKYGYLTEAGKDVFRIGKMNDHSGKRLTPDPEYLREFGNQDSFRLHYKPSDEIDEDNGSGLEESSSEDEDVVRESNTGG